jgi:hypothetical protein
LLTGKSLCAFQGIFLHDILDKFGAFEQMETEVREQDGDTAASGQKIRKAANSPSAMK